MYFTVIMTERKTKKIFQGSGKSANVYNIGRLSGKNYFVLKAP
jgi:hypothetical protein